MLELYLLSYIVGFITLPVVAILAEYKTTPDLEENNNES
jgi:hypothetical protein